MRSGDAGSNPTLDTGHQIMFVWEAQGSFLRKGLGPFKQKDEGWGPYENESFQRPLEQLKLKKEKDKPTRRWPWSLSLPSLSPKGANSLYDCLPSSTLTAYLNILLLSHTVISMFEQAFQNVEIHGK